MASISDQGPIQGGEVHPAHTTPKIGNMIFLRKIVIFHTKYPNTQKQQSVDRYVSPLEHIILILSQPVFALPPECSMLSGEAANTNFTLSLVWPDQGSNPWSTTLKASMLTIITPLIRFTQFWKQNKLIRVHCTSLKCSCIFTFTKFYDNTCGCAMDISPKGIWFFLNWSPKCIENIKDFWHNAWNFT